MQTFYQNDGCDTRKVDVLTINVPNFIVVIQVHVRPAFIVGVAWLIVIR